MKNTCKEIDIVVKLGSCEKEDGPLLSEVVLRTSRIKEAHNERYY